jgi:hypothetical protein
MRGSVSAPKWFLLLAIGLIATAHLACLVPSRTDPSPTAPASPTLSPSRTPAAGTALTPTTTTIIARISEQDMNQWLEGQRTTLGEGVDCLDMHMSIRREGITLTLTLEMTQLRGLSVPVQVLAVPVVRGEKLQMEVKDVQLGGAYAPMSGLVRSMLTAGLAQALDADRFVQQGVRISKVELEDGFVVITGSPVSP